MVDYWWHVQIVGAISNKLFFVMCGVCLLSCLFISRSLLQLLIHTEFLVMCVFFLLLNAAIYVDADWGVGFSLLYLISGGLEFALNMLLLIF